MEKILFHGTSFDNADSIEATGFTGETFFTTKPNIAAIYARDKGKLEKLPETLFEVSHMAILGVVIDPILIAHQKTNYAFWEQKLKDHYKVIGRMNLLEQAESRSHHLLWFEFADESNLTFKKLASSAIGQLYSNVTLVAPQKRSVS